ncbi:MAG: hypothetical protein OQJ97_16670 [Rhodospirillales bacterium]|nr:hypothetical protein [Rhodospirillales bacterium]
MVDAGFCRDCSMWVFEETPQFQTQDEQDGYGECQRIADMMANPNKALARIDEEFAKFQCREAYGCTLFVAK